MTEKQIIEMWKNSGDLEVIGMPYSKIEAFAKAVAQHEREACAKVCENVVSNEGYVQSKWCVDAIRARGVKHD